VTGVDLEQLVEVGLWICAALEREPASRLGQIARRQRG
jgi:hypothetical protein